MTTWIHDLKNAARIGKSLSSTVRTLLATGSGVDLQSCNEQSFGIITAETFTDGVFTITIQESRNQNVADPEAADPWTPVEAVNGYPTASVTAVSGAVTVFNFTRNKRYVRAIATPSLATTGGQFSVNLGSQKSHF